MTRRSAPRAASDTTKGSRTSSSGKRSTAVKQGAKTPAAKTPATKTRSRKTSTPSRKTARIIAVANQKGGVGKSTTAVSLGAALAELGRTVLVVDLDPQGNASTGMGIRHESRDITVYDVLAAEAPIDGAVLPTPIPGLFAIPSTIDLAGAEIELVSQFSRELRLRKALEPLKQDSYDFIFLDCPPSLGLLTVNALAAAEELIVPIQCEYYALEGLGQLLRNVRLVQQNVNPSLKLTGIVMTMFDPRTKLSEQVVQEVRRFFGKRVYKTIIPRTVRLSEAPGFGQPITVYDPKSRGAERYRELAKEVAARKPLDEPLPVFDELPVALEPPAEPEAAVAPRPLMTETAPDLATTAGTEVEVKPVGAVEPEAPGELDVEEPGFDPALEEPGSPPSGPEPQGVVEDIEAVEVVDSSSARSAKPEEVREAEDLPPEAEPSAEALESAEAQVTVEVEGEVEVPAGLEPPPRSILERTVPAAEVESLVAEAESVDMDVASRSLEAPGEPEGGPGSSMADGTGPPDAAELATGAPEPEQPEGWLAELEAQAQAEAEQARAGPETPPVREISLEPEPEGMDGIQPEQVVVIEDRDAAGRHEPRPEDEEAGDLDDRGKRRWNLFRRGGSR